MAIQRKLKQSFRLTGTFRESLWAKLKALKYEATEAALDEAESILAQKIYETKYPAVIRKWCNDLPHMFTSEIANVLFQAWCHKYCRETTHRWKLPKPVRVPAAGPRVLLVFPVSQEPALSDEVDYHLRAKAAFEAEVLKTEKEFHAFANEFTTSRQLLDSAPALLDLAPEFFYETADKGYPLIVIPEKIHAMLTELKEAKAA